MKILNYPIIYVPTPLSNLADCHLYNIPELKIASNIYEILSIHNDCKLISVFNSNSSNNFKTFLKESDLLSQSSIVFIIWISGNQKNSPFFEEMRKEFHDSKNIHFIFQYIRDFPIFLRASKFGIVFHSANGFDIIPEVKMLFALGIPVIAEDNGCIKDLIKDGKTGFIFQNDMDLFQKLPSILENPSIQYISRNCIQKSIRFKQKWNEFYSLNVEPVLKID